MPVTLLQDDGDLSSEEKMRMNIISLNTAVNNLQEVQGKHHKVLIEGNGELPLVEIVRNHTAYIEGTKYWVRFVAGAIIIQTLGFIGAGIYALVRIIPLLEKIGAV